MFLAAVSLTIEIESPQRVKQIGKIIPNVDYYVNNSDKIFIYLANNNLILKL